MIKIDINKDLHGSSGVMKLAIDIDINKGEFVAVAGQSGSGKTTLLRILAGLEEARGNIKVGNEVWLDDKKSLVSQQRKIGFVFQEYALFPNLTVEKNLLYVNNDKVLANNLLDITGLTELKGRLPHTLSGGQKQRVSLCRAMMNRPKLLLMDEPLSALDPAMRTKLQQEILTFHNKFETTTIMVSHDPSEIYRLSSRVIELSFGRIINDGSPKEVLLTTNGSEKFSFTGEILDIVTIDVINLAIISIGQQLIEVPVSKEKAKYLAIGQVVNVSANAFSTTLHIP